MEIWKNISEPPTEVGYYKCKGESGEFCAFFVRNMKGDFVWLNPEGTEIIEWCLEQSDVCSVCGCEISLILDSKSCICNLGFYRRNEDETITEL